MNLDSANRADALMAMLRLDGEIRTSRAATELGVSPLTIRRDLTTLAEEGLLRIVRGGAKPASFENFTARNILYAKEKLAIGQKMLPFVPMSGTIAIDSSTTTFRLANLLEVAENLTVVTNCQMHLQALRNKPGITPLLTGGFFDESNDAFVGPAAHQLIRSMRFDYFFASAASINPEHGGFESSAPEAEVKQEFLNSSQKVIFGVNSDKLNARAAYSSFPWDVVDTFVSELTPQELKKLSPRIQEQTAVV